jgi:hypothetical protein
MSSSTTPAATAAVKSLARLSLIMCWVVVAGAALSELTLVWVWLSPEIIKEFAVPRLGLAGATVSLEPATRLAGFAVSMIPLAVLLYLLFEAYRLFDAYRRGDIFADAAPMRLRRIGLCMVALGFLQPLTRALLGIVLTISNPPGMRMLAIGFGIEDYMIAALGGLILAIGHVMVEATRLADENRQIV